MDTDNAHSRVLTAAALADAKGATHRMVLSSRFLRELEAQRERQNLGGGSVGRVVDIRGFGFRVDHALTGSQVYFELLEAGK